MADAQLILGDSLEVLPTLEAGSADAVCTDPPAGIAFMGRDFDTFRGRDHFIDFLASVLRECLRVLKPGSYAFVWALPRTSHWTATAIEDAGFEVRDKIYHHFGQGFPKGKGCLKPSTEEWILARKPGPRVLPLPGLDECRVGTESTLRKVNGQRNGHTLNCSGDGSLSNAMTNGSVAGRYPPNLLLCHSSLCQRVGTKKVRGSHDRGYPIHRKANKGWSGFAEEGTTAQGYADADGLETVEDWLCDESCPVRLLGEQSGEIQSGGKKGSIYERRPDGGCYGNGKHWGNSPSHSDTGTAARFFPQFSWSAADDVPWLYCPKASRRERNEGCEGLPEQEVDRYSECGQGPLPQQTPRQTRREGNHHPTVKPLTLVSWLVRLITPPGGLCLDPFLGSGTTAVACLREGRRFIGIEQDEDYHRIALARVEAAQAELPLFREVTDNAS